MKPHYCFCNTITFLVENRRKLGEERSVKILFALLRWMELGGDEPEELMPFGTYLMLTGADSSDIDWAEFNQPVPGVEAVFVNDKPVINMHDVLAILFGQQIPTEITACLMDPRADSERFNAMLQENLRPIPWKFRFSLTSSPME